MRKIIALAVATLFVVVSNSNAQLTPDQIGYSATPVTPGLNLIHCAGCGDLDVWVTAQGEDNLVTTLEIQSKSSDFRGAKADFGTTFSGLFDVYTTAKAFKLEPNGFGGPDQVSFGNIGGADNGYSFDHLVNDLVISGSIKGGGDLSNVEGGVWIITVPEPASLSLFAMAGLPLLGFVRRRK